VPHSLKTSVIPYVGCTRISRICKEQGQGQGQGQEQGQEQEQVSSIKFKALSTRANALEGFELALDSCACTFLLCKRQKVQSAQYAS